MRVFAWTFQPQPPEAEEAESSRGAGPAPFPSGLIAGHHQASEKTRGSSPAGPTKVKPSCILVNTARASIVDTTAMVSPTHRRLAAAALDVYDQEPFPPMTPSLSLPNVVISPTTPE